MKKLVFRSSSLIYLSLKGVIIILLLIPALMVAQEMVNQDKVVDLAEKFIQNNQNNLPFLNGAKYGEPELIFDDNREPVEWRISILKDGNLMGYFYTKAALLEDGALPIWFSGPGDSNEGNSLKSSPVMIGVGFANREVYESTTPKPRMESAANEISKQDHAPKPTSLIKKSSSDQDVDAVRFESMEALQKNVPKGTSSTRAIVPVSMVIDPSENNVIRLGVDNDKKIEKKNPAPDEILAPDWTTIKYEDFEGSFPNEWTIIANGVDAYWDDNSYRSYLGAWSGWCADLGSEAGPPGGPYPNNMQSWMVYGPFSLADAVDAVLQFRHWTITETSIDYLGIYASINGANFYGTSLSGNWTASPGNEDGWMLYEFDLTDVYTLGDLRGQSQVWIAFQFYSDGSITYEGSYLDEILLQKDVLDTAPTLTEHFTCSDGADPYNTQTTTFNTTDYMAAEYTVWNSTQSTRDWTGNISFYDENNVYYTGLDNTIPVGAASWWWWAGIYIAGAYPADHPGTWNVKVSLEGSILATDYFDIIAPDTPPTLTEHFTCSDGADPYNTQTTTFYTTDYMVAEYTVWNSTQCTRDWTGNISFYDENNAYYTGLDNTILAGQTDWWWWVGIYIAGAYPEGHPGTWNARVSVEGNLLATDYFDIIQGGDPDIDVQPTSLDIYEPNGNLQALSWVEDPYAINLKARQFIPQMFESLTPSKRQVGQNSRAHVILQFHDLTDKMIIDNLQADNVEILHYISSRSVAASLPANFNQTDYPFIRWIGQLYPNDKISQFARKMLSEDACHLVIEAFPDVSGDRLREIISNVGSDFLDRKSLPDHVALIYADISIVENLARYDEIAWIIGASKVLIEDVATYYCPGGMTPIGPIANYVLVGPGWDGPGLGSASLTYYFTNGTPDIGGDQEQVAIANALNKWSEHVQITWTETGLANQNMSMDLLFASGDHGDGYPFDGPGGVLAHCFYPAPDPNNETIAGDCHFDEDETWQIGADFDMFSVALHESGHGVGLGHSDDPNAVMYPTYQGVITDLQADDITGIKALYAAQGDIFTISNVGNALLSVTNISSNKTWLTFNPTVPPTMEINVGGAESIQCIVDWNNVPQPLDVATVTINSNDPDENPVDVTVTAYPLTEEMIYVTSPNGGESFNPGDNITITWSSQNTSGNVSIDYSTDGGSGWQSVTASTTDDGSHPWTIPDEPSDNCLVQVTDTDGSPTDRSDSPFTITSGERHFTFNPTEDYYPVIIENVTLDGQAIVAGDEVGVFFRDDNNNLVCGGATVWPNTGMEAWGDDTQTPEKDGFVAGEELVFRLWDASGQMEYGPPYSVNYVSGDGTWGNGPFAQISLMEFRGTCFIALNLVEGWNWISANVNPLVPAVEDMWAVTNCLQILKSYTGFYVPDVWDGIGDWDYKQMYTASLSCTANLLIEGQCINPSEPIVLQENWNWVSYLPDQPIQIGTALASCMDYINIVKAYDGFFVPGVWDGVGDMQPGAGYKMHLSQECTLTYPSGGALAKRSGSDISAALTGTICSHFSDFKMTEDYQALLVQSITGNGLEISADDEIGIFTESGLCIGATLVTDNYPLGMMAWMDDAQTNEVDGFVPGDRMVIKYWDASQDQEYSVNIIIEDGSELLGESALTKISLSVDVLTTLESTSLPTSYTLEQNYPNPFNPETTIRYGVPIAGNVRLIIYSLEGKIVKQLTNGFKEVGYHQVVWDGTNNSRESVSSGIYIYRMESGKFTDVKKLIFLK